MLYGKLLILEQEGEEWPNLARSNSHRPSGLPEGLPAAGNFFPAASVVFAREEVSMHLLGFFFFPFFGFGFLFYFLPTIVAFVRERHDRLSVFLLNLFLGWSLIGWVIALVWASRSDRIVYVQSAPRY
jgi:hypothetical protein